MTLAKNLFRILLLTILGGSAGAQGKRVASVEKVSVLSESPLQLQIQTSRPATPQIQMVPSPDRLVIDIPNSNPGPSLRGLKINRSDVRGVRVSQYSITPAITRVVVDLNSPEWYRVAPNASGLVVSLGSDVQSAAGPQPSIGWVSARVGVGSTHSAPMVFKSAVGSPATLKNAVVSHVSSANGATVQFANGQLTIHANNATLSEILFQIQKITGAEIAIPSGTEQERVAADFGPGTASEVMGELLNGTGLNFVVVGTPSDPNQLRSVILTRKIGGADPPSAFATVNEPQASAPVIEPENIENSEPPPPPAQNVPPSPPPNGPPGDQTPN